VDHERVVTGELYAAGPLVIRFDAVDGDCLAYGGTFTFSSETRTNQPNRSAPTITRRRSAPPRQPSNRLGATPPRCWVRRRAAGCRFVASLSPHWLNSRRRALEPARPANGNHAHNPSSAPRQRNENRSPRACKRFGQNRSAPRRPPSPDAGNGGVRRRIDERTELTDSPQRIDVRGDAAAGGANHLMPRFDRRQACQCQMLAGAADVLTRNRWPWPTSNWDGARSPLSMRPR